MCLKVSYTLINNFTDYKLEFETRKSELGSLIRHFYGRNYNM